MTTPSVQNPPCYIYFPGLFCIIYPHIFSLLVVCCRVMGMVSSIEFLCWGLKLMGFRDCGVGSTGFFGIGALHINKEE